MTNKATVQILLFSLILMLLSACDTEDPFSIPPPDFSTVPEAYDTSGIEPEVIDEGVTIYVHEEGAQNFFVTPRDEVRAYITMRTQDGDIIYSSFANGGTLPVSIAMVSAGNLQSVFQYSVLLAYTPGLKIGLLGMADGEQRTIVVEPEQGFGDVSDSNANTAYREDTLVYDILVSEINPG
jgi:hypothetical protein